MHIFNINEYVGIGKIMVQYSRIKCCIEKIFSNEIECR